jgi:N6-adenosine-specific RNA methylase IME4
MKYKTIYADPPWMEVGAGKIRRGADAHYPLMKTADIARLPVRNLYDANEGCHLYLWTTNNFLPDAIDVVKAWGFQYVTIITWMKNKIGLGQYYRGITEHCIFARAGVLPYKVIDGKRVQGVTGFTEDKSIHSKKPEKMRQMIELVSYAPRVELFAREYNNGWDVWGNEVHGITF